ncbi:Translation initiation factor IF-2 [Penicillium atrosanguineum]|uniref:Translation initiation factor IF-2, mitochondrial n=1 Tax=Penicillium atrosanguineum TaxID=1132637 RepID=A0A9W9L7Y3_9EURO|nr:Translation initiation factor IF-2 [Penicillium atrosanguineum]KAJ5140355.1 Translation initiation factor IF-2 [Penicillium atrosanguineum]KAJ5310269.1 Translation initiation factor IF-2 [Penicillium atrosanguineum]KAJ5315786.1 Translation initiation factor IF-2 [Penicillium atrosanguineum]
MHRRAVLRLSRRVDLSTTPSSSNRTCTRTFQSSAIRLNESGNDNGEGAAPKPMTPKFGGFGNRWASKQAPKPTGLSAAEQALRDSIVERNKPPPTPEPTKRPESRQRVPGTDQYIGGSRNEHGHVGLRPRQRTITTDEKSDQDKSQGKRNWRCPVCATRVFKKFDACPSCNAPKPAFTAALKGPPKAKAQKDKQFKHDWSCPGCKNNVFSWKTECPACGHQKPDGLPWRPAMNEKRGANKYQDLGRSILVDHEQESRGGARQDDRGGEDVEAKEKEKKKAQKAEKEKKTEKQEDLKDQWTWDMSALEKMGSMETEPQAGIQKKSKRRDDRKGRQSDSQDADFDVEDRNRRRDDRKRKKKDKGSRKVEAAPPAPLYLPEFISVSNLADVIGVRPANFVSRMEDMGFEDVHYDHVLDAETAGLVAAEFNYEAIFDDGTADLTAAPPPEDASDLPTRPPVVTIMGHVDHGKTTILDWLRKSSVAAGEHGGITQHIGAFSVPMPSGKMITFLDTPGHSAFLEMRRRGADVTDIVVLVVAADDSVKPQTIEAIKHATQANVPVIVAMSKIDKEGCNPDKVKQDLSVHGVHVEDYGGDVQAIGVSGKTGAGMIELEEAIGALSEMLDHRADTECNAEGWVLEASTKSYGRVASALIRRGTLRPGDIIVAGTTWARVRTLRNEAGVAISEATPGMPVEIDGWRDQPAAGTEILQAPTEQRAKEAVDYRLERSETVKMGEDMAAINEARLEKRRLEKTDEEADVSEPTGPKPVNFIIKADVDGSAEAVLNSIAAIGTNEVYANVLRSSVGPISEFDIEHAASANGLVISFNMPIDPNMSRIAESEGVKIMDHNIIYKLIDEVKAVLSEQLPPTITQRVTGEAEVQQVFEITVKGREKTAIAGCRVRNGMMNKTRKVRVIRGNETIYDGTMSSLKNVKKDVTEMRKDTECGIAFEGWTEFAVGDHIQCYEEISEKRFL